MNDYYCEYLGKDKCKNLENNLCKETTFVYLKCEKLQQLVFTNKTLINKTS